VVLINLRLKKTLSAFSSGKIAFLFTFCSTFSFGIRLKVLSFNSTPSSVRPMMLVISPRLIFLIDTPIFW